jgi:hypothetical protein
MKLTIPYLFQLYLKAGKKPEMPIIILIKTVNLELNIVL